MINNRIYLKNKKKGFVAIVAAAVTVMLVVSVGIIGAAPLSVQQQGTGQAPGQRVTSSNIVDGEVRNQDLADDAVTSDKIANGEVTSADIEDGTITATDIAEGTIPPTGGGTPDDNSVTSTTIVDDEVKSADIGDGEVTTQDLSNGIVTQDKIASGAIQLTTHSVRVQGSVSPNSIESVRATCPPGEILTGGGFASPPQLEFRTSFPEGNEWVATAANPTQSELPLVSYAVCATLTP